MSALAAILLDAAAGFAVPMVKEILADRFGDNGKLAGEVIGTIAESAGVTPAELPRLAEKDPQKFEAAVVAAEPVAAELVLAWVESQRLSNALQLAEMEKEQTWTWAWRPAWMYLLGLMWLYALMLRPIVNAALGSSIEAVDMSVLMTLTGAYLALYMGGHTIKDVAVKWKGG